MGSEYPTATRRPPDDDRRDGPGKPAEHSGNWASAGRDAAVCHRPHCDERGDLQTVVWPDGHESPRCEDHAQRLADRRADVTIDGPWTATEGES